MIDVIEICREVLVRLSKMDYETACYNSEDRLIFPFKNQAKGIIDRISEQELRQLFIEEFKKNYDYLYYSIETPTVQKYNFKEIDKENKDVIKQSALHDMCVFEKSETRFKRILNIEFKHKTAEKSIEKDIFKLIHEEQNGAFIFLLDNTNKGTLNNISGKKLGVLDKLKNSFYRFENYWNGDKEILLVIMSLKEKALIYQSISLSQLLTKENVFAINNYGYGKITTVSDESGWKIEPKI